MGLTSSDVRLASLLIGECWLVSLLGGERCESLIGERWESLE